MYLIYHFTSWGGSGTGRSPKNDHGETLTQRGSHYERVSEFKPRWVLSILDRRSEIKVRWQRRCVWVFVCFYPKDPTTWHTRSLFFFWGNWSESSAACNVADIKIQKILSSLTYISSQSRMRSDARRRSMEFTSKTRNAKWKLWVQARYEVLRRYDTSAFAKAKQWVELIDGWVSQSYNLFIFILTIPSLTWTQSHPLTSLYFILIQHNYSFYDFHFRRTKSSGYLSSQLSVSHLTTTKSSDLGAHCVVSEGRILKERR